MQAAQQGTARDASNLGIRQALDAPPPQPSGSGPITGRIGGLERGVNAAIQSAMAANEALNPGIPGGGTELTFPLGPDLVPGGRLASLPMGAAPAGRSVTNLFRELDVVKELIGGTRMSELGESITRASTPRAREFAQNQQIRLGRILDNLDAELRRTTGPAREELQMMRSEVQGAINALDSPVGRGTLDVLGRAEGFDVDQADLIRDIDDVILNTLIRGSGGTPP